MIHYIKENEQVIGLCSTCVHSENCTMCQSFKGKIFQCEEFDDYAPQKILTEDKAEEKKSSVQYSSLKGLCMNCDFAGTCTFSKPETGIWNCNEYK